MTWQTEHRDHTLWATVSETLELLAEVEGDDAARLRALLTQVGGSQGHPHPAVTLERLEAAERSVAAIRAALPENAASVFLPKGSTSSAKSQFETLAQIVRAWPASGAARLQGLSGQAEEVENALIALQTRLTESLAELEQTAQADREAGQAGLKGFKDDAARTAKEVLAELTRIQKAAADAESTTESQKARLDEALNSHQNDFSKQQDARDTEWTEWLARAEERMAAHTDRMNKHEEQSRTVLSAVGVNATATDYGAYANVQATAANRWRLAAVLALGFAALFFLVAAGASFFGYGADLDWWQVLIQKVGAPGGAAAVGLFLARESSQHRAEERRARQTQLTLTALEPFIARLPEDQQQTIRADTARAFFHPVPSNVPRPNSRRPQLESETPDSTDDMPK